jgi:hypothetical protein
MHDHTDLALPVSLVPQHSMARVTSSATDDIISLYYEPWKARTSAPGEDPLTYDLRDLSALHWRERRIVC